MDRQYWENKPITVYWWNFGRKTLDYKGTYKGLLDAKDIKVTEITRGPSKGFHFIIPFFSGEATLDTFGSNYGQCCDEAIKLFFSLLGDRVKVEGNHIYYVNRK